MNDNQPPIIIKKVKGHGEGHHGGAWKVAYADFVTAMMALFIVLWILGQDQSVKEGVENYFKNPEIGFSTKTRNIISSAAKINNNSNGKSAEAEAAAEKERLNNMGKKIQTELSNSGEFSELKDKVKVEFVEEGLRIEMLETSDNIFFEVGTSKLKKQAEQLLIKIGNELAKLPNKIIIEGHTDSRPFSNGNKGYTNFELSADRANSARNALTLSDLKSEQIDEIRGYADRRLRDQQDPFSLVNRRISIIVKYGKKK